MDRFIEWRIITDIILLTAIIYYIYRTLLSTGTWKIALGLTLAVLLAMVARVLGLQGTEWIFSNFSSIALLMLLIIFQPEIRRILERSFFFGQFQRQEKNVQLCELLDQVLFDLAERRWGALIVVPGQVPIRQWVTGGMGMQSSLSIAGFRREWSAFP